MLFSTKHKRNYASLSVRLCANLRTSRIHTRKLLISCSLFVSDSEMCTSMCTVYEYIGKVDNRVLRLHCVSLTLSYSECSCSRHLCLLLPAAPSTPAPGAAAMSPASTGVLTASAASAGRGTAERAASGAGTNANASLSARLSALEASDVRQLFRLHERLRGGRLPLRRRRALARGHCPLRHCLPAFPEARLSLMPLIRICTLLDSLICIQYIDYIVLNSYPFICRSMLDRVLQF